MRFSNSQTAVITADASPLLVVAGPGAGKTTVLTARIGRLLRESAGSNRRILGITYTNVAARNLRDRLAADGDVATERLLITTFHGFATRILQQHGMHLGLQSDFAIINEVEDRLAILSRAALAAGVSRDDFEFRGESLLRLLGRLYERCGNTVEAEALLSSRYEDRHASELFEPYLEQSIAAGQLEFSLLVQICNRLFQRLPAIARQVRKVYEHICVDEFQDTNEMQFRLLERIVESDRSGLMLFADQDQLIYEWNGASPSRLAQARDTFGMSVLLLPTSYRCPENIVNAATRLISNNSTRFVSPAYASSKESQASIDVWAFDRETDEMRWLAARLSSESYEGLTSTAVLARNRKVLDLALNASLQENVPSSEPVTKYEFISAPLVMLQSILRLASLPDRQSVVRRLTSAFYALTGREVDPEMLSAKAADIDANPLSIFFQDLLPVAASAEFRSLAIRVETELVSRKEHRGIAREFFAWVDSLRDGPLKVAYLEDFREERKIWEDLERRHQGMRAEGVSLSEFLRRIDLESKAKPLEPSVQFLTVHSAKGLEFESVFLVGLAEGQFPAFQAVKAGTKSDALEEERRSCFVAITRAVRNLTITFSREYFGYPTDESRFIGEMGLGIS